MMNFSEIKESIRVRLYNVNKETKGITRDASQYGFEGLVAVPVIELGETAQGYATAQIPREILDMWGITEDELFDIAINNTDYTIKTMDEVMRGMMLRDGVPEEMIDDMLPPTPVSMYVITNRNCFYGAGSIIPATKELIKLFPNGYIVLPSSIHEVLVIPKENDTDTYALNMMVRDINAGVVSEEDKLSDDIYEFVA